MVPKEIHHFQADLWIDIQSKSVFIEPWYVDQDVYCISHLMSRYNYTEEDLRNAVDFSITTGEDIADFKVTGPKLSMCDNKWREFVSEVAKFRNKFPPNVTHPYLTKDMYLLVSLITSDRVSLSDNIGGLVKEFENTLSQVSTVPASKYLLKPKRDAIRFSIADRLLRILDEH